MSLSPTKEIIADIQAGRMVILVDEEDRENEGDLVLGAQFATAEHINFMAKFGRGLICLTLTPERCQQLNLPLMVSANRSTLGTNFTVSIEATEGVTTGISAADRARTIQAAVKKDATPQDIIQPGHIFPLMAEPGGVLVRAGHTEAGCDLAQLAGLTPAAVICEILKENGEMARLPDLIEFAEQHKLKIGSIADLIHYRSQNETLIKRVAARPIRTVYGEFQLIAYLDHPANQIHLALVKGKISPELETLVRVHEPLSVIDLLELESGGHAWGVHDAMREISQTERGVLVFLLHPESAEELLARVQADVGPAKAAKMDLRNYGIGAQILRDLQVTKMRLLAVPRKMPSMAGFNLEVTGYKQSS